MSGVKKLVQAGNKGMKPITNSELKKKGKKQPKQKDHIHMWLL